jgi:putative MFS transporter
MSEPLTPNQVAARLDRLPVSRFHYRFLGLISLGAWFDYYDNFVAGSLVVLLPLAGVVPRARAFEWFSALGVFMAALPLGMFVGTIFLGLATDYLGRRFGFVAMLLLYSLASLAGGAGYYPLVWLAGPIAGFVLLLVTRLLAGAGIGAENVIIDAYVSELMPRQTRGWAVAVTHAAAFTAVPAASLLALWVAPRHAPERWWLLLMIGAAGALLAWYFRRNLPESPRWSAQAGRLEEAVKTLAQIEAAVQRQTGPLPPVVAPPQQPTARKAPFREIWSPRYRGRTVMLVVFHLLQTIGYYGFMHWLIVLLQAKGFAPDEALRMGFVASLLAPVGPLLGVWSSERWQRKWLIVGLALLLGTTQVGFGLSSHPVALTTLAAMVVVCSNWFSAVFHAYQAELFPTEARATGVGFTYAWSRASMVALYLIMPGLIATSLPATFALMATALLGVAVTVGGFGPRTNNRALEDVSPA